MGIDAPSDEPLIWVVSHWAGAAARSPRAWRARSVEILLGPLLPARLRRLLDVALSEHWRRLCGLRFCGLRPLRCGPALPQGPPRVQTLRARYGAVVASRPPPDEARRPSVHLRRRTPRGPARAAPTARYVGVREAAREAHSSNNREARRVGVGDLLLFRVGRHAALVLQTSTSRRLRTSAFRHQRTRRTMSCAPAAAPDPSV